VNAKARKRAEKRAHEAAKRAREAEVRAQAAEERSWETESEEDEANECCVCMESPAGAQVEPCGHRCMCMNCATQIRDGDGGCPLCRGVITDIVEG
jgi:hypothetical protein